MSLRRTRLRLRDAVLAFLGVAALLAAPISARAQGVTTGAVRGSVLDTQGQPIVGATVHMVNTANGQRFVASTGDGGIFFVANVVVGRYMLEARAIGFRPARVAQTVGLGRVDEVTLRLEASAVELTAIEISAPEDNSLASPNRTGAAVTVDRTFVANLPSINRNFADFAATNPLINSTGGGTGVSVAGTSDRFNNLQIDGGSNGDLFGLASSNGSPGGANNSRPVSIEAVQEYQVLIAPYDVRQGGFTGGLINAVTRSGTNEFHGSAFYTMQNEGLVGPDTGGARNASDFTKNFYGFSVGGPIVRDRLHFFVSAEWRDQSEPFSGLTIGTNAAGGADSLGIGITRATATTVRSIAQGYGFDPGTPEGPRFQTPDDNIFAKLSAQLGASSQAELSYTRVRSSRVSLSHSQGSASLTNIRDGYQLSNSGYNVNSATNSVRARLNTPFGGRFTNEAIVSYNFFQDDRKPMTRAPQILVQGDRAGVFLGLGGERFSHDNLLEQNILEIADNLTGSYGRHVLTLGGRMSRFTFLNRFWQERLGAWSFADTGAFRAGTPTRFDIVLPGSAASPLGRADGPIADFTFTEFSLYTQDQFQLRPNLSLTFGVRADFQALPSPVYNPLVDTANVTVGPRAGTDFGVRTDNELTSAMLFSPRFGFNYDVSGNATTVVRGGIGLFSGRTPYVWASNAYTGTGLEQVTLTCTGAGLPAFTVNPDSQPTACTGGGALSLPRPSVVYFDNSFKLPQNMRASIGVDRQLPWNMTGSVDFLYTKSLNQFILTDDNLLIRDTTATGEANRALYGTPNGGGWTVQRLTGVANQVLRQYNSNEDYSYSLTFSLRKRFANESEFTAGYTYGRSYDLMSYSSDISSSLLNFAILDGTLAKRNLRPSWFDVPHSLRFSGTMALPYGVRFSLFYTGHSGRPYVWTYSNDVNGDGNSGNDMVYVPADSTDITLATPSQWATLNAFISGQSCLNAARGRILERGSCRNPWVSYIDARVAKAFRIYGGQQIELTANLFNLPALLGAGEQHFVTGFENISMLRRSGYDATNDRGVYQLGLPAVVEQTSVNASRWKLELGARYSF